MPLTPEQCRAARGLLDWTQDELAEHAGVSRGTVRGFEAGHHVLRSDTGSAIRDAFETAGVVFLDPDGRMGVGVRLSCATSSQPGNGHKPRVRKQEGASRSAGALSAWASARVALRRVPLAGRCAIAAGFILAAFALRVAVGGWETGHAYAAFVPVILLGTLFLGALPGLAATAAGWLLGLYFFVEPAWTWAVADANDVAMALLFPTACVFIVATYEAIRSMSAGNDRR